MPVVWCLVDTCLIPVFAFGFFSGFGGLCVLHSFPTRRSSDLAGGDPGLPHVLLAAALMAGLPVAPGGALPLPDAPPEPRADRKSTRLNSSHQINSYAVFCLKKKKTTIPLIPCTDSLSSHDGPV